MSTQCIQLPVVAGGLGAGVDLSALSANRILLVSDVAGAITIEASDDDVEYCPVASFSGQKNEQPITIVARYMRVNAAGGGAAAVAVTAERSVSRFAAIPAPPSNGPGASVDVSDFGPLTTIMLGGVSGNVGIEMSADGSEWSEAFKTFTTDGCQTAEISACFLRAVGKGGSASSLYVGSEEAAGEGFSQPIAALVFRPGATGDDAPGGNVYTDWAELYEAYVALQPFGTVFVEFDSRFSTDLDPEGQQACLIPAGDWDQREAIWNDYVATGSSFGSRIIFEDECYVQGPGAMRAFHGLILAHDGEVNSPLQIDGMINFHGGFMRLYNTNANAKAMFESVAGVLLFQAWNNVIFIGNGPGSTEEVNGFDCPAPIIDAGDGFLGMPQHGGLLCNSAVQGSGFWLIIDADKGPNGPFTYETPLFTGSILVENYTNKHGDFWRSVRYDDPEVYSTNAVATPFTADVDMYHNDITPVDTSGGAFNANFPTATLAMGEVVTVKDLGGACGQNPITCVPKAGETIESPFLATAGGSRTWIADGLGNWYLLREEISMAVVATIAADQTAHYDTVHPVDSSGGAFNLTFPPASLGARKITVTDVGGGANAVTILLSGADTVQPAAPTVAAGEVKSWISDGVSTWTQA